MAYSVTSSEQAVSRVKYSAVRHERTLQGADSDEVAVRHADIHHLGTVRNTRRQVRYNGSIPRLDRSVLGTSGSPEALERFRELADEIRNKADQPVVVVEDRRDDGGVQQALVGELSGAIRISDTFSWGRSIVGNDVANSRQQSASLAAETDHLVMFSRGEEGDWAMGAAKSTLGNTHVLIADIVLDEEYIDREEPIPGPEQDFALHDYVEQGVVLLGEGAIRGSELFEPDLKTIVSLAGMTV